MRSRLLTLLVVVLLTLPIAAVLPPVQAGPQPQEAPAPTLAAKKKQKKPKPKFTTVTTIVRQSVTQTFPSAGGITIPTGGTATPYPSPLDVAGFTNGVITDVNLLLTGFSHTIPDDVDILLVPAHVPGQDAIVLSDVGAGFEAVNLTLTLDDQAAAPLLNDGPLVSGTFQPTNAVGNTDAFSDPAPAPSGTNLLSVFNGSTPNGEWRLFVQDDQFGGSGSIDSWALQITAEVDVQVQEQVKVKKTKKKGKKRR